MSRIDMLSRRASIGLLVLTALLVAPSPAQAQGQAVKPYVMLVVDTSTSMIWDLCHSYYNYSSPNSIINGDNSTECPGSQVSCSTCNSYGCGNGVADDSRLYKVKKGAYSVVSAFGEVTWGLSRFRQIPATFTCDAVPLANQRIGGWTWQTLCTSDSVGSGGNQADVLVGFSDNNQDTILKWLNNADDYSGTPPTSGCNLCPDCGGGCDMEIRAAGNTPIAGSLYDLRTTYFPSVISSDSKSACRPYKVILLTDGINTCPGNPATQAAALFNNASKSIQVHVVGFGDPVMTCNNHNQCPSGSCGVTTPGYCDSSFGSGLDAIADAGDDGLSNGSATAVVVDNEVSLALEMAKIISESLMAETCNGSDDDCDGQCDETWPEVAVTGSGCSNTHAAQSCTVGLGICQRTGSYVCKSDGTGSECNVTAGLPNPGGEICDNALDDDCDGAVDEGCPTCSKQPEVCNGKDDDCDTLVDEGYVSTACGSSIGECAQGTTACENGTVVCKGATPPSTELCDNKDNNCDTIVDNFSQVCYPASTGCNVSTGVCQGVCQVGSRLCTNGSWGSCLGYKGPTSESCNGLDDDCDGTIDEGVTNTCTNYTTCASYTTCSACLTKPVEICNGKDDDCNKLVDDNALLVGTDCGNAVGECTKGKWACVSGSLVCQGGTKPATETCDNKDNDCNGKIDDAISGLGGTCGSSVGECKTGTYKCIGGKVVCSGGVDKGTEICDLKDNDCDGTVDNNIPSSKCGSDVGECIQGTTKCVSGKVTCTGATGPTAEICDGKDNDCDGTVDDSPTDEGKACGSGVGECTQGVNKCISGKLQCTGGSGPKTEICDGLDNDCNGKADDKIAGTGTACGKSVGECQQGAMACVLVIGTGWTMSCLGGKGPSTEICDLKDNDCDGSTDESDPKLGTPCGTNIGECKAGSYVCEKGNLICKGSVGSTAETCDCKDNDCNGAIDDKVPGEGDACGSAVGECKQGKKKCVACKMICTGGTGPTKEICDGKDNDCDGKIDNNAECPGTSVCIEGQCVVPCQQGEFVCPGGTKCINNYCMPDKCGSVKCKDTERCVDGKCISKCSGVVCESHEACNAKTGQCVDDSCLSKGCPKGKLCSGYKCIDDPCPPGKCKEHQICSSGKCYETCANVKCPAGQSCVKGQCTTDKCANYDCPDAHKCEVVNGKPTCVADPCRLMSCVKGETCFDGKCIPDPCETTTCPEGYRCELSYKGEADCAEIPGASIPTTNQLLATGAGGCACELGERNDEGFAGLLLLLVAGLWFVRRRRSRANLS